EKRVGKSEVEQVLHRLLAEVVIDAEDVGLVEDRVQRVLQRLGRGEIATERFLDDHTRAVGTAALAKTAHDGWKHARRNGEIVQWMLRGAELGAEPSERVVAL